MIKARKIVFITCFVLLFSTQSSAQFSCPGNLVYSIAPNALLGGNPTYIGILNFAIPASVSNPSNTTIPSPSGAPFLVNNGLALMPNINGGNPSPTLYSVLNNGNFCYWNGSVWVDTGHYSWNGLGGINGLGGCNTYLYGLNVINPNSNNIEIYRYDGTGSAVLLTTLSFPLQHNFAQDMVTDCNCNFYLLNDHDGLLKFNSNGQLMTTYTINPVGGNYIVSNSRFAIIGDTIYLPSGIGGGVFADKAVISGNSVITLTNSGSSPSTSGYDYASCPFSQTLSTQATINSSTIGCNPSSLNLAVNATLSPLNYSWSGPGIGAAVSGSSVMNVNTAGIYTCELTQYSCDYVLATLVSTVTSYTTAVTPVITPSNNLCLSGAAGNLTPLFSSYPISGYSNHWAGASISSGANSATVHVNGAGIYTLTVTDISNGCAGTATANILATPQISLGLSSNTMCVYAYDTNHIISLSPGGAMQYSIYASPGFTVPIIPSQPIVIQQIQPVNAFGGAGTATLVGSNGVCSSSVSANFTVLPVSQISVTPSSTTVCKNTNQVFQASGAISYIWQPQYALSTINNNKVTATLNAPLTLSVNGIDSFGCGTGIYTVSADVFADLQGNLSNWSDTYCAPFCASFSFAPALGSSAAKGIWQIENKTYPSNAFIHCFEDAGDYVIKGILTDSVHHCANAVSFSIQAYPRPVADFVFEPAEPVENDKVIFKNNSSGVMLENDAVWYFSSNQNYALGENADFFYADEGKYPVAMLVKNSFGCADTIVKTVNVLPDFFVYVPNVFTPNGDRHNETFAAVTRGVKFFSMVIFNRWGDKLFESSDANTSWDGTFLNKPCPEGLYIWKIEVTSVEGKAKSYAGSVMLER